MATATRKHSIVNPARLRKRNASKRRLSAKQIKAGFGGKRRQSSLKASKHRKRSVANPRHKHAVKRVTAKKSHRKARRRTAKRGNPGEILSLTLGNPGGKRRSMAKRRKKNASKHHHRKMHASSRRRNPGRRRAVSHRRIRRRSNPGGASIVQLLTSGVFAAGGLVLSRFATQAVLGPQNAGMMGYAGNAVATVALAWATHLVSKNPRNRDAVILGGTMGIIARLITDYTPYGQFLQSQGFGDYGMGMYLQSNDPMPSRLASPNGALVEIPSPGWAPVVASGMGNLYGGGAGGGLYN